MQDGIDQDQIRALVFQVTWWKEPALAGNQ
jgi:hypothetical protein